MDFEKTIYCNECDRTFVYPKASCLHIEMVYSHKKAKSQEPKESPFDFNHIYNQYPVKKGKKAGKRTFDANITTKEKYDNLQKALNNYLRDNVDTEIQYIKHFSTFMNCYEDWIDYKSPTDSAVDDFIEAWEQGKKEANV